MKTFIRRPGNKTNFLKYIIPKIPEFSGTYIEPFLGTGAVYLHLLPKKAILNDLNKDIIGIWKLVREDPEYLLKEIDAFKKTFLPLSNEEKLKKCRKVAANISNLKGNKRYALYLLLVYCSFNGVIEFKNKHVIYGLSPHIYSSEESSHVFTEKYKEKIRQIPDILKNIKIYSKDYSQVIAKAKRGDFVFLDPPYVEEKKYQFQYNKNEGDFSNIKLKEALDILTSRKVKWMMTQIDTKEIRELFKKYNFFEYINSNGFVNRIKKKELIITNY